MEFLLCACVVLCIFFLRDVFLFGSSREPIRWKLGLYSILTWFYLLATMRVVSSMPEGRALELLSSAWIWASTLLIHVGLWGAVLWSKRRPIRDGMWVIALLPSPMFILSLIAASHQAAAIAGSSDAFTSGLIASAVWIGFVLIGVAFFRLAYRGWEDDAFVAVLAEIASWTGLGILPFTGIMQLAAAFLN